MTIGGTEAHSEGNIPSVILRGLTPLITLLAISDYLNSFYDLEVEEGKS